MKPSKPACFKCQCTSLRLQCQQEVWLQWCRAGVMLRQRQEPLMPDRRRRLVVPQGLYADWAMHCEFELFSFFSTYTRSINLKFIFFCSALQLFNTTSAASTAPFPYCYHRLYPTPLACASTLTCLAVFFSFANGALF
ncbi:hypothetical protein BX070DRAFT_220466 [Coemansia spiralis]|nr:hypothetical protein BX070DRAFT_220466 [Coemansia spiralis]